MVHSNCMSELQKALKVFLNNISRLITSQLFVSKIVGKKLYHLVDCLGYSLSDHTWELNVRNAQTLFDEFHRRDPSLIMTQTTRCTKGGIVSRRKPHTICSTRPYDIFKRRTIYEHIKHLLGDRCLNMNKLIGLFKDDVSSMIGSEIGTITLLKNDITNLVDVHCIAHREALVISYVSRDIPELILVEKNCK